MVGVRVPACYEADESDHGTRLVLEDLADWQPGADPVVAAAVLSGIVDLAWLLVSSVDPARWDEVIDAYGPVTGLAAALPAASVQGLLRLVPTIQDSPEASGWVRRLDAAAHRL